MNSHELSAYFGKEVVAVRDGTLREWRKTFDGQMRDEIAKRLAPFFATLSPDQLAGFRDQVLPDIVDTCIHNFLAFLEGTDELKVSDEASGISGNMLENPDGLIFPFFGEEGWIARFSKFPSNFTS